MDDKFNENELELNPSVDSADEPTTAEEAKTETGYEQNDNWEFEAKASTLDETLVESDEYEIQIPQHTAEVQDSAPRPAEKKNTSAPAPSASKPQSSGGLSSNAVKFVIAGVMTVIIIGVLGILGWRYYALPNTNEQMNPLAEKWLNRFLFAANNDLKDNNSDGQNTKGYATALEAVIGFLFLKYPEKVFGILKKQFSDEIILNNRK